MVANWYHQSNHPPPLRLVLVENLWPLCGHTTRWPCWEAACPRNGRKLKRVYMVNFPLGVSIKGGTPESSIFCRIFSYRPSILGYIHLWKLLAGARWGGNHPKSLICRHPAAFFLLFCEVLRRQVPTQPSVAARSTTTQRLRKLWFQWLESFQGRWNVPVQLTLLQAISLKTSNLWVF